MCQQTSLSRIELDPKDRAQLFPVVRLCDGCGFAYLTGGKREATTKLSFVTAGVVLTDRELRDAEMHPQQRLVISHYECFNCQQP